MSGIRTDLLNTTALSDSVLVHRNGSLLLQSAGDLNTQLAGSGQIAARFEELRSQITGGLTLAASWTALSALSGSADGQGGEVPDSDTGTHAQATATGYDGATVPNAGRYSWHGTWSRWVWVAASGLSAKAPLASPVFTGTPQAPTATLGTNSTQLATTAFVQAALAGLIDAAPGALDTLNELAAALGDDPNFAGTMTAALASKAPLASPALTGTPTAPTAPVGTNTTQVATTAHVQAVIAALVNAAPGALDTLNELAAALGDDPNFAATVTAALATKAPLASPVFTGAPQAPTPLAGTNSTQLATTAFVQAAIATRAAANSPAFTGIPTAPTAEPSSNSTQIATTAFVQTVLAALIDAAPGAMDTLNELAAAMGDDPNFAATVTNALATKAPLASPVFTGTPQAPTATPGTNTAQLATTGFVKASFRQWFGPEMAAATEKPAPVMADRIGIADSEGGNATKWVDFTALQALFGTAGRVTVGPNYSPQGGNLPGAGSADKGDLYRVSATGTAQGLDMRIGDAIMALVDEAASDDAADWFLMRLLSAANRLVLDEMAVLEGLGAGVLAGDRLAVQVGPDGRWHGVLGPARLSEDHLELPPGVWPQETVTDVTGRGGVWQYRDGGIKHIVVEYDTKFPAAMPASLYFWVAVWDGQSWNTLFRMTDALDELDPSGLWQRRLENWPTGWVTTTRHLTLQTPIVTVGPEMGVRPYSTDTGGGAAGPAVALRRLKPGALLPTGEEEQWTLGHVATLAMHDFLRQLRAARMGTIVATCGRPGTPEAPFLPPGGSFLGPEGPVLAEVISSPTQQIRTLWENDDLYFAQIASVVDEQWGGRDLTFEFTVFDQGGAGLHQPNDDSYFFNFLNSRRGYWDSERPTLRAGDGGPIRYIVPIGHAQQNETFQGFHPIDQIRFATQDPDDRNFAAGPYYHLPLLVEPNVAQAVHPTAGAQLLKAEDLALALAHIMDPRIARWDFARILSFDITASVLTVDLHKPMACGGAPVIDAVWVMEMLASAGFQLHDFTGGTLGAQIGLGPVTVVSDTRLTLPVTGSIPGTAVELTYATRGTPASPAPAEGEPVRPGCIGNVKFNGLFKGPFTEVTIDRWLAPAIIRQNL